ncbi:uncharacterized protein LDX57_002178 [Aspergillus melleus]|uniref:uncharacterized protein n=1 Tax=Aspergillus melleus TaxID=138277 RepID=UPI001E8D93C8|nr:uncharacterized protein LDX57_002178 [Aspergillus melleus]KAH8424427.1 hypothetical protein LDX57_002178 [Aspergillus melleus]
MPDVTAAPSRGIRKPRKSRGRGLRATTGCLICKRRHVKCDEVHPQCGPCAKGQRACVYGDTDSGGGSSRSLDAAATPSTPRENPPRTTPQLRVHEPLQILVDACQQERPVSQERPLGRSSLAPDSAPIHENVPSPATESTVSNRTAAPRSWFELLATDAVNADENFYLSPQLRTPSTPALSSSPLFPDHNPGFHPRTPREHQSFKAASFGTDPEIQRGLMPAQAGDVPNMVVDDPSCWTTASPIQLSPKEYRIFNHFVKTLSSWLDFFDPSLQFSTVVPHLALRNVGLMKALLALSARHLSLWNANYPSSMPRDAILLTSDVKEAWNLSEIDRNLAVQYYYETLTYLNKAMKYSSYASSPELISTALLISTYEMVDGSNRDWERHLKGVFWIQRYQNNNGECGGIRQAVWWAWLRQDAWVAMRERRRVFTFWKPEKHYSMLTPAEMACHSHYLLAQCINYASKEESESKDLQQRLERGSELLAMLQEWLDYLPSAFRPLPTAPTEELFPPIWVHPPSYGAALQLHSLARILVLLHRPSVGGLHDYRAGQRLLTASVSTICGIAKTVDENDNAACLVSLNSLYGAGMCVHTPHERSILLELMDTFQQRVRWPSNSLRRDLELDFQRDDLPGPIDNRQ